MSLLQSSNFKPYTSVCLSFYTANEHSFQIKELKCGKIILFIVMEKLAETYL